MGVDQEETHILPSSNTTRPLLVVAVVVSEKKKKKNRQCRAGIVGKRGPEMKSVHILCLSVI